MGIFSSQKKTVVATSAQRIIKDKDLPDSIKTGTIKGIFEGGSIPDYMMEELANSIGHKAERMYEYGRGNGSAAYMFGNPQSTVVAPVKGNATVLEYLRSIAGSNIAMNYLHFGAMNIFHFGFTHLAANYGYSLTPNTVTFRPPGIQKPEYKVYLDSMVAFVHQSTMDNTVDSRVLSILGPDPNGMTTPLRYYTENLGSTAWKRTPYVEMIPDTQAEFLRINLTWEHVWWDTSAEAYQTENPIYSIDVPLMADEFEYYQALYSDPSGKYSWWQYQNGSGIAVLDNIFFEEDPANALGSFFPWIYLRYDKSNPLDDEDSQEVKQGRKMAKYLGLSYDMLVDAIHENPDSKDVEQAMMMMCVPANTTNALEQRYLFEFFDQMNLQAELPNAAFIGVTGGDLFNTNNKAKRSIIIEDKRFKLSLGFNYMKKLLIRQNGDVGKYSSGTDFDEYKYDVTSEDGAILSYTGRVRYHWYRYQVTESQCEEIRVSNLRMTYHIWGQYTDTGNDEEEILLVPIDRSITKKYSARIRETLYARSLHFIFNTRQIITLKWYQREWFQIFLIVVTIIIAVLTWGQSLAANLTALGAGTLSVTMAIQMSLIAALKYLAAGVAIKLFVKTVGGEAAMILALLAMAYGIQQGGKFIGEVAQGAASWATNLIRAATSLLSGVGSFYKDEIQNIINEMNALTARTEQDQELIESAQALLENQTLLSPLTIFGETPDQYFRRTVQSGNIGVMSLEFPRTYVEQALTLPDFANTIQGES